MSMQVGMRDSPTLKRGKASRSTRATRRPPWARKVAVVVPPGPAPITSTSASREELVTPASYPIGRRRASLPKAPDLRPSLARASLRPAKPRRRQEATTTMSEIRIESDPHASESLKQAVTDHLDVYNVGVTGFTEYSPVNLF